MKKTNKTKSLGQLNFPTAPRALDSRELAAVIGGASGTNRDIEPCFNPRGVAPCFLTPCFNPIGHR